MFNDVFWAEPSIIVDLDGTLANVEKARVYVRTRPKNFEAFHTYATTEAPVYPHVRDVMEAFANYDHRILLVTGRMEKWRQASTTWLRKNNIYYDRLWMRADGDYRQDYEVKRDIYDTWIRDRYNVMFAIDDSPNVVKLWRELEIPVFVIPGYEDEV